MGNTVCEGVLSILFLNMGASWVPVLLFTAIWGIVGGVLPFVLPRGPHKGVMQVVLILTACCCWLFWLCCYMSQMNPLIGPILSQNTGVVGKCQVKTPDTPLILEVMTVYQVLEA